MKENRRSGRGDLQTNAAKAKAIGSLRRRVSPFVRYVKVKADANPFDPAWDEYFAKRAKGQNRQRKAKGARDAQAAYETLYRIQCGHNVRTCTG